MIGLMKRLNFDMENLEFNDIKLVNYESHKSIKAPMAV